MNPFDRFFDDAAIFPPGNAPMDVAIEQHFAFRDGDWDRFVGPFVVSDMRLFEIGALSRPLDISLICTGSVDEAVSHIDDRFTLTALEIPVVATGAYREARDAAAGLPAFIEVGWNVSYDDVCAALSGSTSALKLRTGGISAEAFPSPASVAAAIAAASRHGVPFKCTAGLHQGVRYTDSAGFTHHGFLNLLLAAASNDSERELTAILERTDAGVVTEFAALSANDLDRARSRFLSFGTCSVAEPIEDLQTLGLFEESA